MDGVTLSKKKKTFGGMLSRQMSFSGLYLNPLSFKPYYLRTNFSKFNG